MKEPIAKKTVLQQLLDLGVVPGGVLLVHTSFSTTGPIEGGPEGLIEALRDAVGLDGTLVVPAMWYQDDELFDPATSECDEDMGIVADTFWRLPGTLRSDSPHSFAAVGPHAAAITAPHPVDPPHGIDSPVGHVYGLDGKVLLLGVGHDYNTTIHLAEELAPVRYRRPKHVTVLENGRPTRFEYDEIDHCCQNFSLLDEWLDDRQRIGTVGHGTARLMRSRDVVEAALERLRAKETVFLHPPGVDIECDEARASIPA